MLAAKGGARATPINAVLLSDAELDHVSGLLSLRETQPIRLYCTARVFDWVFRSNPVFEALIRPAKFNCTLVEKRALHAICNCDGEDTGLAFEAFFVAGKVPGYVRESSTQAEASTVAYRIVDTRRGTSLFYIPTIRQLDEELIAALPSCDCLMFDGSFWSEHEMESCGVGSRTASAMGHLPIDGPGGSLARLSGLGGFRKIYTHINNTNPILDETSAERRAIQKAGWVVAEDAMDFEV